MIATAKDLGILFDWDGVIIDSSRQHEASWERLAEEEGALLPVDHFVRGFGKKNEVIIPGILRWTEDPGEIHRISLRKEALYRDIVVEQGVEALPGVHEFLLRLNAAGVRSCVGSSTHRENIDTIMEVLGFQNLFDDIVTAEDVTAGKPHPDVFLKAAGKISRDPQSCIVFEDAKAGIEAGRAGGMKVVGVATTHDRETLLPLVDRVVDRLDELEIDDLLNLFR
ncbi:MAG: HAD family phosphatase [Opitutaceae bacterium]|jgi:HAD superfamily hydrolase (TIGR01509 family)|nr:HAD family phosphatase [Opitutaceae bacterium]